MRITFDQGPAGGRSAFDAPVSLIQAFEADEVADAFDEIAAAQSAGHWIAGFASYELGYALEPKLAPLMPKGRRLPLMQFGVYDAPKIAGSARPLPVDVKKFVPRWDEARYGEAFASLHDLIGAGDLYQANLTFPIDVDLPGTSAAGIYESLAARQRVGYGVLIEQEDGPDMLSRSPELFFRTDTGGRIQTRPMKGTQPRAEDPVEDQHRRDFLKNDEKNQAENLMIVDLLRNDISRVCEAGSVQVPELFAIESYATVHQMVSLIEGKLLPDAGLADILAAIFPCGSITGAPKVRAMQVIHDLEPWPRDLYCGAIGWAAPDGRSEFNVAIRTLMREKSGKTTLNVGGGVVWDSTAASEYEEALWKARFLSQFLTD